MNQSKIYRAGRPGGIVRPGVRLFLFYRTGQLTSYNRGRHQRDEAYAPVLDVGSIRTARSRELWLAVTFHKESIRCWLYLLSK